MKTLAEILTYRRPHGSEGERKFVERFLTPLNPVVFTDLKDEVLAYAVTVGEGNDVLFSCHIDTMHDLRNQKQVFQRVCFDTEMGVAYRDSKSRKGNPLPPECLGADDAAGIWVFLNMIEAKVPGTYIFHRGEERGCIGSKGMAEHHKEWLSKFNYAIAIDRKKDCSVITHQGGSRCCSQEFAEALCKAINADFVSYTLKPDDGGVYTDTAEYVDIIGECTNISAGYMDEHTANEMLELEYIQWLSGRMIDVFSNNHNLPVARKPGEYDPEDFSTTRWGSSWRGGYYGNAGTGGNYTFDDDEEFAEQYLTAEEIECLDFNELKSVVLRNRSTVTTEMLADLADEVMDLRRLVQEYEFGKVVAANDADDPDDDDPVQKEIDYAAG